MVLYKKKRFILDTERGYWGKNEQIQEEEDPLSQSSARVIPYVEDYRNCLLVEMQEQQSPHFMASLQAVLKNAIQIYYQLEEAELAAEPLPHSENRKMLLYYESAEGGAGVLRHLVDDSKALGQIAEKALELCHFDPKTGKDLRRAAIAGEDCEAACYYCLMSYSNQADHQLLDRHKVRDILLQLTTARVNTSPVEVPRHNHLKALLEQAGSSLEKKWLNYIDRQGLPLPANAQKLIDAAKTRPDFLYAEPPVAVFIDGPEHDKAQQRDLDEEQTEMLEDLGYRVIRFSHRDDWDEIIKRHADVFRKG